MTPPLPPPVPGTAVGAAPSHAVANGWTDTPPVVWRPLPPPPPERIADPSLPVAAAVGAIVVLTASLVASKLVLDALVGLDWPVLVYVALLALLGYGPSLAWCRFVSRRWGTGRLRDDIGLRARWADLGWGPIVWLGAIAAQLATASLVLALDLPISNNTDAIESVDADRTYIVSIVITAVIAAPLVEEMVFRGVVQRGLRSRLPIVAVIALQGVLFGVAHVDPVRGAGNLGLVLVLSGVGIALGVATALFRRLGPAIIAHAIFNGVVLLIVLTGVADRLQELDAAPGGSGEEVVVVDQAHVADAGGDRDPVVPR